MAIQLKLFIKKMFALILKTTIIFAVIYLTTYGFLPSKSISFKLSHEQMETRKNLLEIVTYLSETIGTRNLSYYENLEKSAGYITRIFKSLGYEVEIQSYDAGGQVFKNIIASRQLEDSRPFIVVGAHYDSCYNPGADDNASGVAGLLELARLLKDNELKTPVRFATFTNEEPPFFHTEEMGSRVYAKALKKNKAQVKAAVILEMIGYYSEKRFSQKFLPLLGPFYPNKANFIGVVGNFRSARLVRNFKSYFKSSSNFPLQTLIAPEFIPGVFYSDHWSFWKEGYPAIMITDTAYLRSEHYHEQTDLPNTLNFEKMAVLVHTLKGTLIKLVNHPGW